MMDDACEMAGEINDTCHSCMSNHTVITALSLCFLAEVRNSMSKTLNSRIIKIGNSCGIRIPQQWLDQHGWRSEVQLILEANQILIRSSHQPRQDWEAQFRELAAKEETSLLNPEIPTHRDEAEWEW